MFNINKRLKGRVDMTMALGLSDVKAQMAGWCTGALSPAMASTVSATRCVTCRRLKTAGENGMIDPHRDRAQMLKVENVQQAWQQRLNKLPPARRDDEDVQAIRWMIEELRVSFLCPAARYAVSDFG